MAGTNGQYDEVVKEGYEVFQVNGQRITQAQDSKVCIPKGCEIFVGRLPRDIFENKIYEIFSSIGPIFKIRLMLDFSGFNRGYTFVTYYNKNHADEAVRVLDNLQIMNGTRIGVYKSVDNCRLYVGGIPSRATRHVVLTDLQNLVDGVKDVIMYQSYDDNALNRGYAFVEFIDHRAAAIARRNLCSGSLVIWGTNIYVDWADPLPDVDQVVMSQVKKLYLNNLDVDISMEELRRAVEKCVNRKLITRVYKNFDYAFVHLITRDAAEYAMDKLKDASIKGKPINVTWARPPNYSKANQTQKPSDSLCTSLPFGRRRRYQKRGQFDNGAHSTSSTSLSSMSSESYPGTSRIKLEDVEENDIKPQMSLY